MVDENELFVEHRKGESGIRVGGHFIPFLKKGQPIDFILCVRKGWDPLEEAGVVPGSRTGKCDTCGQDIWLAPSTLELMKDYPAVPTRCVECVLKEVNRDKMDK